MKKTISKKQLVQNFVKDIKTAFPYECLTTQEEVTEAWEMYIKESVPEDLGIVPKGGITGSRYMENLAKHAPSIKTVRTLYEGI